MGPQIAVAAETSNSSIRKLGHTLREMAVTFEDRINLRPARAFFILTCVYLIAFFVLSSFKLLWVDELITLHIARLGSFSAIWQALAQGADPNPPLTHLLVHLSRRIFGEHEFALRLPAMIGYWLGMVSLFFFLYRRLPATWAISGTVLSMTMAAFDYSYESRSYGIFYGFCMAAVFCWSRTVDPSSSPTRRRLSLAGMVLALAAGISANYFAVLAFLPIAAGELARTFAELKRPSKHAGNPSWDKFSILNAIDLRIWAGLLLAATPLIAFRGMIAHSIAEFAPYAWNKVSVDQVFDSYTEMVESSLYPVLAILVGTIFVLLLGRLCATCRANMRPHWLGALATEARYGGPTVPFHEAVTILFLMAYPILGYIIASIRGGMLSPRFVIPVCFGFAIAGVLAVYRMFRHLPGAGAILLCCCIAWFVARESVVGYWYVEQKQCFYKVLATLPQAELSVPPGAPIAIPDPLMALTFQHYAPPALVSRVVFPIDFPAIRLYRRDDSAEENIWAGRNSIYTLHVMPLANFQHATGRYLILASDGNWLVQDLLHHRYPVDRLDVNTRAGAIGGFTPLNHGTPVFFTSVGDQDHLTPWNNVPIPFHISENLPNGKLPPAEGGPFDDRQ